MATRLSDLFLYLGFDALHRSTLIKAPSEIILPLAVLTGKITLAALFERLLLIRMALTSTQAFGALFRHPTT